MDPWMAMYSGPDAISESKQQQQFLWLVRMLSHMAGFDFCLF